MTGPSSSVGIVIVGLLAFTHASHAGFVNYNANGVSGNAPQWNASTWDFDCTPLPATRGAGLGLAGGSNQFAGFGVATTPTLNTANNDYIRFGFTLSAAPSAEYLVTGFRASVGSFSSGSIGMQYQLWAFLPDAGQQLIPVSSAAAMSAPGTNTPVNLTITNSGIIAFPNETVELRMYFWGASSAQSGIAFTNADGNVATPDVEIFAIPIPGAGVGVTGFVGMLPAPLVAGGPGRQVRAHFLRATTVF